MLLAVEILAYVIALVISSLCMWWLIGRLIDEEA